MQNPQLNISINLQVNVYGSFIHNYQNLEVIKVSSEGEQINELCYMQTMGCYSTPKINEQSGHEKTEEL